MEQRRNVSFAIVGSGGAGAITAGSILLESAGKSGLHGLLNRSVGPQIRGGEAAALVRLSTRSAACMSKRFDILAAIDWKNADRFIGGMPVAPGGLVIADPAAGEPPQVLRDGDCTIVECPISELAKAIEGGRPNMIAVGLVTKLIGLPVETVKQVIASKLESKGPGAIETGALCVDVGIGAAEGFGKLFALAMPEASGAKRWLITGNDFFREFMKP